MPWQPPIFRPNGYATLSARERQAQHDKTRGTAAQRGYGYRWQRYREQYLKRHPRCVICEKEGRLTLANEVDHIKPHRGDAALFWNGVNHQALCKPCHSRKTVREDGGGW